MHIVLVHTYLGSNHAFGAESLCTNKWIEALAADPRVELTVVCYPDPVRFERVRYVEIEPAKEGKYGTLWRNFRHRYPGAGIPWAQAVAREILKLHQAKHVDVLHTRSQPMDPHVVGMLLREIMQVPWLAHFSDPVPTPGYLPTNLRNRVLHPFFGGYHARVVAACDDVSYPCERLLKYVQLHQWGNATPRRGTGFALPHILPAVPANARKLDTHKTVMLHCGKFYEAGRRPDNLLRALARLVGESPLLNDKLLFAHMGGEYPPMECLARELGLGNMTAQLGTVTPERALEYSKGADALILIEHEAMQEGIYFPSKLADYLALGNPVLALTPRHGATTDLIGESYPFRADPWDLEGIHAALRNLCGHLGLLDDVAAGDDTAHRIDASQLARHAVVDGFLKRIHHVTSGH